MSKPKIQIQMHMFKCFNFQQALKGNEVFIESTQIVYFQWTRDSTLTRGDNFVNNYFQCIFDKFPKHFANGTIRFKQMNKFT
jgi:hypothetical protein